MPRVYFFFFVAASCRLDAGGRNIDGRFDDGGTDFDRCRDDRDRRIGHRHDGAARTEGGEHDGQDQGAHVQAGFSVKMTR